MSKGANNIANDGRYAVQTKRIEGFAILRVDPNTGETLAVLTLDTSIYFQKLWIYPGASATSGIINANAAVVYVGNTAVQIASKVVTLEVKAHATDRQTLLVTAYCTGHGFATGDVVRLSGASDNAYNNEFQLTRVDADNFTFMLSDVPLTTEPTGTITAKGLQAFPAASLVTPDALAPTDLPLKYELPLGQRQQLASIMIRGTASDGVFYRVW